MVGGLVTASGTGDNRGSLVRRDHITATAFDGDEPARIESRIGVFSILPERRFTIADVPNAPTELVLDSAITGGGRTIKLGPGNLSMPGTSSDATTVQIDEGRVTVTGTYGARHFVVEGGILRGTHGLVQISLCRSPTLAFLKSRPSSSCGGLQTGHWLTSGLRAGRGGHEQGHIA